MAKKSKRISKDSIVAPEPPSNVRHLRLVVNNEHVEKTDRQVLDKTKEHLQSVISHVFFNGLGMTGDDWLLAELQEAERNLDSVLNRLYGLHEKLNKLA